MTQRHRELQNLSMGPGAKRPPEQGLEQVAQRGCCTEQRLFAPQCCPYLLGEDVRKTKVSLGISCNSVHLEGEADCQEGRQAEVPGTGQYPSAAGSPRLLPYLAASRRLLLCIQWEVRWGRRGHFFVHPLWSTGFQFLCTEWQRPPPPCPRPRSGTQGRT